MNDHVTFLLKMVSTGVLVGLMSLLLMACEKGGMEKTETFISIKDIPQEQWDRLARKKIYFGHQSVGYNIVDGLVDLLREYPDIRLNIVETHDAADFNVALFAHSKIGRNVEPERVDVPYTNSPPDIHALRPTVSGPEATFMPFEAVSNPVDVVSPCTTSAPDTVAPARVVAP